MLAPTFVDKRRQYDHEKMMRLLAIDAANDRERGSTQMEPYDFGPYWHNSALTTEENRRFADEDKKKASEQASDWGVSITGL